MYQTPNYLNQYPSYPPMYSNSLNGMYVESRAVVDSTQGDLSGKPMFLPTTDGSAIYVKQLDNFGKSHVTTYIKQNDVEPPQQEDLMKQLVDKVDYLSNQIQMLTMGGTYESNNEPTSTSKNDNK